MLAGVSRWRGGRGRVAGHEIGLRLARSSSLDVTRACVGGGAEGIERERDEWESGYLGDRD